LRLLFFGNFRQDWTSVVLVDLGMQRFESVPFSPSSRPFQCREEIEQFHTLYLESRLRRVSPILILEQLVRHRGKRGVLRGRRGLRGAFVRRRRDWRSAASEDARASEHSRCEQK